MSSESMMQRVSPTSAVTEDPTPGETHVSATVLKVDCVGQEPTPGTGAPTSRRLRRRLINAGISVVLLFFLCASGIALARQYGPSMVIEVQDGYHGPLIMVYDDPTCPPLKRERRAFVFSDPVVAMDASGRGCTSDELPSNWFSEQCYLVDDGGHRVSVQAFGAGGSWQKGDESILRCGITSNGWMLPKTCQTEGTDGDCVSLPAFGEPQTMMCGFIGTIPERRYAGGDTC